ncbi:MULTISPECIES: hypothetical protein [unclassified Exiguobacterium]|uniref:hypothetical protein n=1 Tax=unclassified Exiguobacterium TaxID=2644629 RepID=UPI001BE9DD1C|nr:MULTISPECIES: hypothetical protein [unclassified Exiguobacterium]
MIKKSPIQSIPTILVLIIFLSGTHALANATSITIKGNPTLKECVSILEAQPPPDQNAIDVVDYCENTLNEAENESNEEAKKEEDDRAKGEDQAVVPPENDELDHAEPASPEASSTPESEIPLTPEPQAPEEEESPTPETEIPPTPEPQAPEEEESPTPETDIPLTLDPQVPEEKESLESEDESSTASKSQNPALEDKEIPVDEGAEKAEQRGALDVALVGSVNLTAAYEAAQRKITLTADMQSVLSLGLGSKYVIFQLPQEVMQSIQAGTISLSYSYTGLLGAKVANVPASSIQQNGNQIYAEVGSLLALSLLSKDIFTLSFKVNPLPVGTNSVYTFESSLTSSVVDLDVLNSGFGMATLTIGPVFNLKVPEVLDFGTQEIRGREGVINRKTAMTIEISHQNALNYDWKLRARLTAPLSSEGGDVLDDVLLFKVGATNQTLQTIDSEIASGKMGATSTILTYGPSEGIILDLTGKRQRATTYQTQIQWTLVNAP